MKKYNIKIKANPVFPFYLQHRMDDVDLKKWEESRGRIIERKDLNQDDIVKAEYHSYKNLEGDYYIPANHIMGALINAGKLVKAKVGNATKSMTNVVAGMFYVKSLNGNHDQIPIGPWDDILKVSAVNQNIKARVMTYRPKWKDWSAEFELIVDNDTVTDQTIKTVVEYAGAYVGIGSWRPEKKGQYGRYVIEEFKKI